MLSFERDWARLILDSFAPPEGPGLAPRPGEIDTLEAFDVLRRRAPPLSRFGLRASLWLVIHGPLLLGLAFRRLHKLPRAERLLVLERLLEHRVFFLREATFLMKTAACLALFRSETVRGRSHYDGRPAPTSHG